jgi:hypothetical protein
MEKRYNRKQSQFQFHKTLNIKSKFSIVRKVLFLKEESPNKV